MLLKYEKSICYSGFRLGQSPYHQIFPTKEQIKEDLLILISRGYHYIRLYDPSLHAKRVLEVIKEEILPLKVFLGFIPVFEIYNPNCPWGSKTIPTSKTIQDHILFNNFQLNELIDLSLQYPLYIAALSIGNENTASWNENIVSEERLLEFVKHVKEKTSFPVTFNEGYGEWKNLKHLAQEVDFISIHIYPSWQQIPLEESVSFTIRTYNDLQSFYPFKQIVIGEAGWPTSTHHQMRTQDIHVKAQQYYVEQIEKFSLKNQVIVHIFEAFDEPWKGGNDPLEPEKHWGIYYENRTPKY